MRMEPKEKASACIAHLRRYPAARTLLRDLDRKSAKTDDEVYARSLRFGRAGSEIAEQTDVYVGAGSRPRSAVAHRPGAAVHLVRIDFLEVDVRTETSFWGSASFSRET